MEKRIVFLPIWGKQNETIPQRQMEAIRSLGGTASYGLPGTFFPLTRSAISLHPDVISIDWIHQYTVSPGVISSIIKSIAFLLDAFIVRFLLSKKLVWTIHNLQHHDPRPRWIENRTSRIFAKLCTSIRILGEGVEEQVCRHFAVPKSKLVVFPEGSYSDWYPQGISKTDARILLGLDQNAFVWLYLGNLRPYKGVEQLISAFQKVAKSHTRLVIAGNPWNRKYAESIESQVENDPRIKLILQTVPDSELQNLYAAADLVVLPFIQVFNSGTVLLAMSFAKPVVAPAMGVISFRLQHQPQLLYKDSELESALLRAENIGEDDLLAIGRKNKEFADQFSWLDFGKYLMKL
jgi:beta-1,4-mannosyltransferase